MGALNRGEQLSPVGCNSGTWALLLSLYDYNYIEILHLILRADLNPQTVLTRFVSGGVTLNRDFEVRNGGEKKGVD